MRSEIESFETNQAVQRVSQREADKLNGRSQVCGEEGRDYPGYGSFLLGRQVPGSTSLGLWPAGTSWRTEQLRSYMLQESMQRKFELCCERLHWKGGVQ